MLWFCGVLGVNFIVHTKNYRRKYPLDTLPASEVFIAHAPPSFLPSKRARVLSNLANFTAEGELRLRETD